MDDFMDHKQKALKASFVDREIGSTTLNTTNSVRQGDALNCKICNHKLNPIYIANQQKHLEFKLTNPLYHVDEEGDEYPHQQREGNNNNKRRWRTL